MATGAELNYNTSATAVQMAQSIFGSGTTVVSATYSGDSRSKAIYSAGTSRAPGVVPSDTGVILSTGRAVDFTQSSGDPNRSTSTSTDTSGLNNVLNAVAGANTFDAAILDVDFVPTGNVMTMQFVFSSEEYPEFATSQYNDTVGIWINGTNVPVSFGSGKVSVSNVNGATNGNLYTSNTGDLFNTEMDGFTLKLSVTIPVNPGVVNSIRIGIADVADARYDSNLLIGAQSLQTSLVALDDTQTMYTGQTKTINVLGNDINSTGGMITVTEINGIPVVAGQTVTLPSGDSVRLNGDGTLTITTDADVDKFNFTYGVKAANGQTDIGIVNVDTVPCFVAGTPIRTTRGDVTVESLSPGDLVLTHDHGPQPVRWIGRKIVPARDRFAPVRIAAGTFGPHGTLMLSPQHRVMIRMERAELLFGDSEVLVAAKDLVDGQNVKVVAGGWVEYVHILFDRHELVLSKGLTTESFLPGPQATAGLDRAVVAEILEIFPDIDLRSGAGYGPSARRTLKAHEAQVLVLGTIAA